jgi:hypothetical protein
MYQVDKNLLETLKICVEEKDSHPSQLASVSMQLRGGMDKNMYSTTYSTGKQQEDQKVGGEDDFYLNS